MNHSGVFDDPEAFAELKESMKKRAVELMHIPTTF
jgi:hypothetical protein